jgi:hypothetical protein
MKPKKKSLCVISFRFPERKQKWWSQEKVHLSIFLPSLPLPSNQKETLPPLPPPFPLHFQPKILEGIMIEKVQEVLRCIPKADMMIKTFMRKNKNNCFTKSYRGWKKETG